MQTTPLSPLPQVLHPFENQTGIGNILHPGSCTYDTARQVYTVTGAGHNIWADHDDFHFVWRPVNGDFIVTARAAFMGQGVNPHRKFGWMARASLDADSAHVCVAVHDDGLISLQFRRTNGGLTEELQAPIRGADVIQLERHGNRFILSVAHFGDPFTTVALDHLALGNSLYTGIFVCSHEDDVIEQVEFSNVRFVIPLPAGATRETHPFESRLEVMNVVNGHRQVVFTTPEVIEAPNWTRDGSELIYNSHGRLYRFNLQTQTSEPIDTGDIIHNNNDHVLSFDGSMLAISSHDPIAHHSLVYTVPLAGGQPLQITPSGPSYLHGWSPDGRYLVYTGQRGGIFDIYRIPAMGGAEEQLTATPGLDDGPEYTPDGQFIYFNSVRSGTMQIWRMAADGSNPEPLTQDAYNNWFPHITPDGRQIVFISYLEGEVEPSDHPAAKRVYLRSMPVDGGTPQVIAYLYGGQGTMNVPSWSPDGARIAFVSNSVPMK